MSKRLAITISGAVSLGSYEAGVLYEILAAIAAHNTNASTPSAEKILIDVLTGASAGGMCATILAQKLLYDGAALTDPNSNALHDPWVNDISLTGLLKQSTGDDPTHSLFSSQLIDALSKKYITGRYETATPPAPAPHPAIDPAQSLRLGLSLSNLDGIDYAKNLRTGGQFVYTRYLDEYLRVYSTDAASDKAAAWEDTRNAAVSCGAFPFAFAVKALQRTLAEYASPMPAGFPQLNMRFAYTDGGVFQNEPLGMAKNFVDEIDNHLNSDSRFYLFIAPGSRGSTIAAPLTAETADFLATAKALVGAVFNQARFHDWIMAEEANRDVEKFNRRATQLMSALLSRAVLASDIEPATNSYLQLLQASDPTRITINFITDALDRLKKQFATEYLKLATAPVVLDAGTADIWLRSILVLELAADLDTTDEMNIFAVTASDSELAGSSVEAFAGFFDQRIRQHDYDVGRNKAKEFIRAQNTAPNGLGPFRYDPGQSIPIDPAFNNFSPKNLSVDERTQMHGCMLAGADTLLEEAGVSGFVRWVIKSWYIGPKLKAWLAL